jgi:hypothetical protein
LSANHATRRTSSKPEAGVEYEVEHDPDSPLFDPLAESARIGGCSRTVLHEAAAAGELDSSLTRLGRLFFIGDVLEWGARREESYDGQED